MDGNGRWAKARGLPRLAGHRAGVEALRKTRARGRRDSASHWLTVYAFSSENWSRPKSEVSDLMGLLKLFIRRDLAELHQNGVRVRIIGERERPADRHRGAARRGRDADRRQPRAEPCHRLQLWRPRRDRPRRAQAGRGGRARRARRATAITPEIFARLSRHRRHSRSGPGHPHQRRDCGCRISCSWQAAYSELVFLPCYWPDFSRDHLAEALRQYAARERRFGGVPAHGVALVTATAGWHCRARLTNLQLRIVSAVLLGVVRAGGDWLGGCRSACCASAIAGAIFYEWMRMCANRRGGRGLWPMAADAVFHGRVVALAGWICRTLVLAARGLGAAPARRSRLCCAGAAQWEGRGLAYAGAVRLLAGLSARRRPCRPDRDPVPVRGRLGDRHPRLFRRPRRRRPQAGAVDLAGQDLERRDRRRGRRRGRRPGVARPATGVGTRVGCGGRAAARRRVADRRPVRIVR